MKRNPDILLRPGEVIDDFMKGRLRIIQSKSGYRFSIDAVFLSDFVVTKPGDVVVDLGTGCGFVSMALLLQRPLERVFAVEIQPDLADQAARNARLNGFSERMEVILGDMRRTPLKASSADVVVCNPPYRKKNSGRINPDLKRAIARHEILACLNDVIEASKRILRKKGRLALVYPAVRLVDALAALRGRGLEPKRIRIAYPGSESRAALVLVEAREGGKAGLEILPPLFGQGEHSIP